MANTNYTINNGALPTWHDKYVAGGTTPIDLDQLLIPTTANDKVGGFNTPSASPIAYRAAHSDMKLFYTLPCYTGTSSGQYVLDGCGHFNSNTTKLSISNYDIGVWTTIERAYNSTTQSYGFRSSMRNRPDGTTDRQWDVTSKAPYITYLIISGGGGGGSGSNAIVSGGGGGGASVLQLLIDWTQVSKIRVYRANGGRGGEGASLGVAADSCGVSGEASNVEIYLKIRSAPTVTFIIPGGKPGWLDGDGGAGGGIPTYTLYNNLTPQNVSVGLPLPGVYCLDYWQGSKGGAVGKAGTGKTRGEIKIGPSINIEGATYSGGDGNYGGGGGASAMGFGGIGSDYVNGSSAPGGGGGGGGAAFATVLGGGDGGKGGWAGCSFYYWYTNY